MKYREGMKRVCVCCGWIGLYDGRSIYCPICRTYFDNVIIRSKKEVERIEKKEELKNRTIPIMNRLKIRETLLKEVNKLK